MRTIAASFVVVVVLSVFAWAETPATQPAAAGFTGAKEVRLIREAAKGKGTTAVITKQGEDRATGRADQS